MRFGDLLYRYEMDLAFSFQTLGEKKKSNWWSEKAAHRRNLINICGIALNLDLDGLMGFLRTGAVFIFYLTFEPISISESVCKSDTLPFFPSAASSMHSDF